MYWIFDTGIFFTENFLTHTFVIDGWKRKADIWTETDFVIRKCFSG